MIYKINILFILQKKLVIKYLLINIINIYNKNVQ